MDDIGVHDGTRCELNVARRNHAGNRSEHKEVVSDDGAFNAAGFSNADVWRTQRTDDIALDIDWSAGGDTALDDKVMGENAAT